MKSSLLLKGIYPNNLHGPPKPAPPLEFLEKVRAKLDKIFGSPDR